MSDSIKKAEDISEEALFKEFLQILEHAQISTVFQPILSLRDASILGYEVLSRGPSGSAMHYPSKLFELAEKHDYLWDLELLCRTSALDSVFQKDADIKIFLNVNPNIMNDHKFINGFTKEYLKRYSMSPEYIVFEITERNAVKNYGNFIDTINHYKEQDYQIAIDDAGAGYSGLNLITDIHPHFVKLDMNLIRNIDKDTTKHAMVKSMFEFSRLTDTELIAEGIETAKELETLIEIGIHFGQGYFIQKPSASLLPIDARVQDLIRSSNQKKNRIAGYNISQVFIGSICDDIITVTPDTMVLQVNELLNQNPDCSGFCITTGNIVIGVITKAIIGKNLARQYGYSLYSSKPISLIMNTRFLAVDHMTPIDIVAKLAMAREEECLYDFITVTKDGTYMGIVTVKQLIEKAIEIEVIHATHLNPLTGLPGNIMIEQCLEKCIISFENFSIMYFDIDNFKVFNDVYGFENGDKIIRQLSAMITRHVSKQEFVGHIGGDDLIAILPHYNTEEICKKVIKDFDEYSFSCYTKTDQMKGFIIAKNRHGIEESYPLLSLSIAVITNEFNSFKNVYDLSEQASSLKKKCKLVPRSSYMIQ